MQTIDGSNQEFSVPGGRSHHEVDRSLDCMAKSFFLFPICYYFVQRNDLLEYQTSNLIPPGKPKGSTGR